MKKKKVKIPKGLYKCPKCGEYRGRVRERDLSRTPWEQIKPGDPKFLPYETPGGRGYFEVSCICDGILCPYCKKNKVHRPTSNIYDPKDGQVWYVPTFGALVGCGACHKKKKAKPKVSEVYFCDKSKAKYSCHEVRGNTLFYFHFPNKKLFERFLRLREQRLRKGRRR